MSPQQQEQQEQQRCHYHMPSFLTQPPCIMVDKKPVAEPPVASTQQITFQYISGGKIVIILYLLILATIQTVQFVLHGEAFSPTNNEPARALFGIPHQQSSSSSQEGDHAACDIQTSNVPTFLPFDAHAKFVKVQTSWIYNPSIIELANGQHLFTARMSWYYSGNCNHLRGRGSSSEESLYNCLFAHSYMLRDQTIMGLFHPSKCEFEVVTPQISDIVDPEGGRTIDGFDNKAAASLDITTVLWNTGTSWYDTRLLYPFSRRYQHNLSIMIEHSSASIEDNNPAAGGEASSSSLPLPPQATKILMTSQKTESIGNDVWFELEDDSRVSLQLMYLSAFDPNAMVNDKNQQAQLNQKKMSRLFFYDRDTDRKELSKRRHKFSYRWQIQPVDIARAMCQPRPEGLPQLAYDPEDYDPGQDYMMMPSAATAADDPKKKKKAAPKTENNLGGHRRRLGEQVFVSGKNKNASPEQLEFDPEYFTTTITVPPAAEEQNAPAEPVNRGSSSSRRRLAALSGNEKVALKDKNWAPFAYEGKILWSYTIHPHVVCETDVDLNQVSDDTHVQCIMCEKKYHSSSPAVFDEFYGRFKTAGYHAVDSHLNGVPSYYVDEQNAYLGVMHVLKRHYSNDTVGHYQESRHYEHYFYLTEPVAPFRVKAIAAKRLPLTRSLALSPWFWAYEKVEVEFVTSMLYHPDRTGHEIVVSYGDGDNKSRTQTFSMAEVRSMFESSDGGAAAVAAVSVNSK